MLKIKFAILVLMLQFLSFSALCTNGQTPPQGSKIAYDTANLPLNSTVQFPNGDTFVLVRELGKGSFGVVFKAVNQKTNEAIAIKINFREAYVYTPPFKSEFIIPIKVESVQIMGPQGQVFPDKLVEIMPIGVSLEQIIRSEYDPVKRLRIAHEMLGDLIQGLRDMNYFEYAHNDIKPDNIIKLNGKFVLADLGSSRKQDIRKYAKGTIVRMAPEQFTDYKNSFYSDAYQLGMTLLEVIFMKKYDIFHSKIIEKAEGGGAYLIQLVDLRKLSLAINHYLPALESSDRKKLIELYIYLDAALRVELSDRTSALNKIMLVRKNTPIKISVQMCRDLFI